MSRSDDSLSALTAAGSKSRSIRVRALAGACSVREYTILSAARQICVKSRLGAVWSGPVGTVSQ